MTWLNELLAEIPEDLHWSTRRRMAIIKRWPLARQAEAQADVAVGKTALRDQMVAEIEAIKAAIPNGQPPAVPGVVSRFQARAALHLAGLLDDVEALMTAPGTPALAKLAWADAQEFKRNSPTVQTMAAAIGLTEAQLDELFTTAAGIDA